MPLAGVDVGGGRHVPPQESITTTYAVPTKHPTLAQWAYPVDATTSKYIAAPTLATATSLDASWTPTSTALTAAPDVAIS